MDYRKIIEAQNVDESKLPADILENIASIKKLGNLKGMDKKKQQLNDLIYHQIIDWLADEEERLEAEENEKKTKELEERIAAHKAKLESAGMVYSETGDSYSNACGTQKVPTSQLGTEELESSIDSICEAAKNDDNAFAEKKAKEDAINEAKRKRKEKADNFGLF